MLNDRLLLAEWAEQDAVILCWPHKKSDWRSQLPKIEQDYLLLANTILRYEPLIVICFDSHHRQHIQTLLAKESRSRSYRPVYVEIETNDTWCRDFCPLTIIQNQQPVLVNFQFNGWGNRYPAELDNRVTEELSSHNMFQQNVILSKFILEGGSIETDGQGTLLTTERCLLNCNRNHTDKGDVEQNLQEYLGTRRIFWLKHGYLEGDDTDSHIDNLARFTSIDTIAYLHCDDTNDPHFDTLDKMRLELENIRQYNDRHYNLVPLPLPKPCYSETDGRRLPASYLNFLIINNAVLIPAFDDANDLVAQQALQRCFPDRKIIPVRSDGFIQQGGGLHCLTMQFPKHTLRADLK